MKQISSLGCHAFGNGAQVLAANPKLCDVLSATSSSTTFRIWLYTSDNGPDQASMRRSHMRRALTDSVAECIIDDNCNMHQLQIVIKNILLLIDSYLAQLGRQWKYYPTITKISHLWRNNARAVFMDWSQRHGAASAMQFAKSLPPKPIAGRWGLITRSEDAIFAAPQHVLFPVLEHVLFPGVVVSSQLPVQIADGPVDVPRLLLAAEQHPDVECETQAQNNPTDAMPLVQSVLQPTQHQLGTQRGNSQSDPKHKNTQLAADQDPDECRLEAQAAYRQTMTRWKSDVACAVADSIFYPVVVVARKSRQPLDHLLRFFQKPIPVDVLNRYGGHTAQLQAGRSLDILARFDDVINTIGIDSITQHLSSHDRQGVINIAFHSLLQGECELQRRVFRKLNEQSRRDYL